LQNRARALSFEDGDIRHIVLGFLLVVHRFNRWLGLAPGLLNVADSGLLPQLPLVEVLIRHMKMQATMLEAATVGKPFGNFGPSVWRKMRVGRKALKLIQCHYE
jgi:hypothetical protein